MPRSGLDSTSLNSESGSVSSLLEVQHMPYYS